MSRAVWPLVGGRPVIQIELQMEGSRPATRTLLADTGAGSVDSEFELILDEEDCVLCGGRPFQPIELRGAYSSSFPAYLIHVSISSLGIDCYLRAGGVQSPPSGLDGIACLRFLSRFAYGNFGERNQFGFDVP